MRIIKSSYQFIGLLIVVAAVIFQVINIHFLNPKANDETYYKQSYAFETFRIGKNGWGYSIKHGKKIIIKQDIIPAIQKSIPFQSEKDARKTALLVIQKLNHRKLPAVTVNELDSLQVVTLNNFAIK